MSRRKIIREQRLEKHAHGEIEAASTVMAKKSGNNDGIHRTRKKN